VDVIYWQDSRSPSFVPEAHYTATILTTTAPSTHSWRHRAQPLFLVSSQACPPETRTGKETTACRLTTPPDPAHQLAALYTGWPTDLRKSSEKLQLSQRSQPTTCLLLLSASSLSATTPNWALSSYPFACPLTFFVIGHPHCRAHHPTHLSRQSIETPFCLHSINQHGISGRRPRRLWPLAARCLARRCMLTSACDAPHLVL
jgi:hypothetical protein